MKYILLFLIPLISGCVGCSQTPVKEEPKVILVPLCVVNSINNQTTCGPAMVDMENIRKLKDDEVIIILSREGKLFVTIYQ